MYIFWFLHQTTTFQASETCTPSCISFDSYIKPQPLLLLPSSSLCCISFDSYIKPQLHGIDSEIFIVVYLLIPTSNHNCCQYQTLALQLYIFWFLHQTTTVPQLTTSLQRCISFDSYIKPQLLPPTNRMLHSCISFYSYIKPQLTAYSFHILFVVYLLIPTSNHNLLIFSI